MLVGQRSRVEMYLTNLTLDKFNISMLYTDAAVIKLSNKSVTQTKNNFTILNFDIVQNPGTNRALSRAAVEFIGLEQGSVELSFAILDSKSTLVWKLIDVYVIKVVHNVNVVYDAFMYVMVSVEMLTLFMLGFRIRRQAIREALVKPSSVIVAIICRVVFMPLVSNS